MKKIIIIFLMALATLTSCEKNEVPPPPAKVEVKHTAYFSGYANPTAELYLYKKNGSAKTKCAFNIPIEVVKGDRLIFFDKGTDIMINPQFTLYNYYGPGQNYVKPAEWEEGFTYGVIIVDGIIVAESVKNLPDVDLSYIVK